MKTKERNSSKFRTLDAVLEKENPKPEKTPEMPRPHVKKKKNRKNRNKCTRLMRDAECILQERKSHVSQFLVDLSVQEGSLVAREGGLQALFDKNADYWDKVSKLYGYH
jgi:hypothetical protein